MRITIDTDLQVIIVPNSYYTQVDALNDIIESAGGRKLDYTEYIETLFQKAYRTKIICQSEVADERGKKNKNRTKAKEQKNDDKPAEMRHEGEGVSV